jgi:hypothetical protein
MDGLRFVARFVSGAAYIDEHRVPGAHQTTNLGVRSSNLFGRARFFIFSVCFTR